ncbi:MAG: FapA family protein [Planctomycetota bacterium]|nr:FapA family protein [Planctomycetota bacterium]
MPLHETQQPGAIAPGAEADSPTLLVDPIEPAPEPITLPGTVNCLVEVPDGARLRVGGNFDTSELVRAAQLLAAGSITASAGISGRGEADIRAGGSLTARFAEAARLVVGRSLVLHREAIGCDILVHGSTHAADAAIIGGTLVAGRAVRVRVLGSDSAVPTRVVLGSVPLLEPLLQKLTPLHEELTAEHAASKREFDKLNQPGLRLDPRQKERQTELSYRLHTLDQLLLRCMTTIENAGMQVRKLRTVDLDVREAIHPGVILVLGADEHTVRARIEGPIRIARSQSGDLVYRREGDNSDRPMKMIASLRTRAR